MPPLDSSKALSLLIRGYSARRVADEVGVSNTTVSNLLNEFINKAKEARSILAAAVKYGIEEQVRQLIVLGGVVEETKVDASETVVGLRIVKAVKAFGVDSNSVLGFVEAVYKEAMDQTLAAETFVKVAKGMHGMKVEGPKDYVALEREVEDKRNLAESFEKKASEMDEALKRKETTIEELSHFTALRDRLAPRGLDLNDADKAESCLINIAEQGNDPNAVVSLYSKGVGISKKVSEQENRAEDLSKANTNAERKLTETNKILESKTEFARRVKEAEDLGLIPSQLGAVVETARKTGARQGLGIKDSINRLVKDLEENWEPKLGFENEKTRLAVELDQLNEKIKLVEGKERVTQEKIQAQEKALSGLEELKEHVSASEIIEFKKVIVDSGNDIPTFRSEIERLGSVTALVNSVKQRKEAEQTKLVAIVTALSAQVSRLVNSKTMLEAEISTLNSEAIKGIREASKTITDVAEGLKLDFEAPETGYKARIQSLGSEAIADMDEELRAKRETLRQSIEGLSKFVNRSASDVENLKKNTWDTAKLIGYNTHLTRLAKLVGGEPVETLEALATMKMTVDAFSGYLASKGLASRCPSGWSFSAELRSVMT
jgi:hypothetical protein